LGITDIKSLSAKTLKPAGISLEIEDDSYIKRKNDFCALQEDYSVNEYITEHVRQVGEYFSVYGIEIEDELLNAYKQLLITQGSIRFEADLSALSDNITEAEELKSFSPNDIIQFIHLKLFINDKRINQLSLKVDRDKLATVASGQTSNLETPEKMKKKVLVYKKYHRIFPDSLKKYNGYRVKIETKNGKSYKGTLKTDNPKYIEVLIPMRAGNIGYQISKQDMKKVEVFY
ncbi:MAG: hypothetical protein KAI17_10710, partial [Thiotrichaceae bacterium]|nr:hypothetical protein [Thiotrichaceae bacterium]